MASTLRKATFNLDEQVLDGVQRAVLDGEAPSKNAFVERALRHELAALRRERRRREWEEAHRDPLFVRDIEEVEAAFGRADAESVAE